MFFQKKYKAIDSLKLIKIRLDHGRFHVTLGYINEKKNYKTSAYMMISLHGNSSEMDEIC